MKLQTEEETSAEQNKDLQSKYISSVYIFIQPSKLFMIFVLYVVCSHLIIVTRILNYI